MSMNFFPFCNTAYAHKRFYGVAVHDFHPAVDALREQLARLGVPARVAALEVGPVGVGAGGEVVQPEREDLLPLLPAELVDQVLQHGHHLRSLPAGQHRRVCAGAAATQQRQPRPQHRHPLLGNRAHVLPVGTLFELPRVGVLEQKHCTRTNQTVL